MVIGRKQPFRYLLIQHTPQMYFGRVKAEHSVRILEPCKGATILLTICESCSATSKHWRELVKERYYCVRLARLHALGARLIFVPQAERSPIRGIVPPESSQLLI